ncbi:glycosyltransferase family 4 protein [Tessaracoccus sp.]
MNVHGSARPRVLMGAYACGPSEGPEASAGWAFALAAAADHDVWVLCRRRFVEEIAEHLAADATLAEHLHVVHIDLPDRVFRAYRTPMDMYWYYSLWQMLAARTARRLHARIGFDVTHHVTFANDWLPAGVGRLKGVPYVWGPVGGATRIPVWRLRRWLGVRGVTYEVVRLLTNIPRRIFGDVNARRARVVVAQNRDVAHRFRRARRVVVEPNASLDPDTLPPRTLHATEGLRAVFVGRLIPLKGGSLAVSALARPDAHEWTLDIYGDGPERSSLESLSLSLGVSERVVFHGHRPREEALHAMAEADVLLFPSMHDQAGWAAAEASSMGTPVVCLPLGGPPTMAGPNAFLASLNGDIVGNLVEEMNRAAEIGGIAHGRWSPIRLRAAVADWYSDAMGDQA